jgi:outer membrane protein OmpA-like peptidoglycan-associated protein
MFTTLKKLSLGLVLASTLAAPAMACHHEGMSGSDLSNNLVVNDMRGQQVKDLRGNCIYTKWTEGTNTCGSVAAAPAAAAGISQNERTIYFGFNSATLSAESVYKLNRLLGKIKDSGSVLSATIVGHADHMGDAAYNQSLSARRANAVRSYLASHGFSNTKVTTVTAEGENAPVTEGCDKAGAKGATINCLQPDRRVEVQLNVAK